MSDEMSKLVICGIIAKLRSIMGCQYRVKMSMLSDAYADDYYENMILVSDMLKIVNDLEKIVDDRK